MLHWLVSSSFSHSYAVAEGGEVSCFPNAASHHYFPFPEVWVSVSPHHGGLIRRNLILSSTTSFYHFYTTSGWVESEVKGEIVLSYTLLLF